MKRIIIILAGIALPLVAAAKSIRVDSAFTITIKTRHTPWSVKAYLLYQFGGKKFVDSSTMQGHIFRFSGHIGQPVRATLIFDEGSSGFRAILKKKVSTVDALPFYIHPGNMVAATNLAVADAVFSLSEINRDFSIINRQLEPVRKQEAITSEHLMAERDTAKLKPLEIRMDSLKALESPVYTSFIKRHPGSYAALIALQEYKYYVDSKDNENTTAAHRTELQKYYHLISPGLKNTVLAKQLEKDINAALVLKLGAIAPGFAQPDVNGKMISLSDYRGKYVLLDLWASWCGPCRQNNPDMVKLYHDFKSRNFTILGISLDDMEGRSSWIKAIRNDGLEWTQVSDLKHWDNLVVKLYSVKAIPESILIGPDGRIVARGLSTGALRDRLNKLLPAQ